MDSFSVALSNELKDSGVTVTCLMPGATETDFFERADVSHIAPDSTLAEMHRGMAEPGSGKAKEPKSKRERTDRPRV